MSCSFFYTISNPALIFKVNEKTVALTGLSANELIGKHRLEVFHSQPSPPDEYSNRLMLAPPPEGGLMLQEEFNVTSMQEST